MRLSPNKIKTIEKFEFLQCTYSLVKTYISFTYRANYFSAVLPVSIGI